MRKPWPAGGYGARGGGGGILALMGEY